MRHRSTELKLPLSDNTPYSLTIMRAVPDTGMEEEYDDRGFGGIVGANRHVPPYDHSKVETCPDSSPADYGPAPGLNPDYGSKGVDGKPVSGHVTKTRLSLGK